MSSDLNEGITRKHKLSLKNVSKQPSVSSFFVDSIKTEANNKTINTGGEKLFDLVKNQCIIQLELEPRDLKPLGLNEDLERQIDEIQKNPTICLSIPPEVSCSN